MARLKPTPDTAPATCICPKECDCQKPPPNDWDGKNGAWLISNFCPIHNISPDVLPDCPVPHEAEYRPLL